MLTVEQQAEYLDNGGQFCPHCKQENIDAISDVKIAEGVGVQEVTCFDCDESWSDIYTLTGAR